jgi:hypothetical protein
MTKGSIGLGVGQMQSLLDQHEDTNGVGMETNESEVSRPPENRDPHGYGGYG